MLKAIGLFLFAFPLFLHAGDRSSEAAKYNDALVLQQDHISTSLQQYGDVVMKTTDSLFAVKSLEVLIERIAATIDTVKNYQSFYGDDVLRLAALDLFTFYQSIAAKEYREILSLLFLPEDMADTNAEIEEIVNSISMQEFIQANKFAEVQTAFATKYGFVLNANGAEN
jgi:hypothetical protein